MKDQTENDKLFGVEGVYTHAYAQARIQTHIPRTKYAALVEALHAAGIDVIATGDKNVDGKVAKQFVVQAKPDKTATVGLAEPTAKDLEKALALVDDELICNGSPIIYRQAKWLAHKLTKLRELI